MNTRITQSFFGRALSCEKTILIIKVALYPSIKWRRYEFRSIGLNVLIEYVFVFALALLGQQFASYRLFSKEICWSSRKFVILRRQLNKNIKLTMLQRRMNNWITVSDRGIKCLERLSCVHTSGIGAFYTFGDISRRTFDRPSGIQ